MSIGTPYPRSAGERHRLAIWPTTSLGTWAVGLAAAGVVLIVGWSFLGPLGGLPGLACGLVGGVLALVAILRRGERALTVFAALFPFLNAVVFLLAEVFIPH